MNLAVTSRSLCDVSGKPIREIPDVGVGITALKMVRASGNLSALLLAVTGHCPSLERLNVSSCSLASLNRDSLCQIVAKETLQHVDAAHVRGMSAEDLAIILASLNSDCRTLNLADSCHADPVLWPCFARFRQMEVLSLAGWMGLSDEGLSHLPTTLSSLDLSRTSITRFSFLKRLSRLAHLDLDGVRLTDSAQDDLVSALSTKQGIRVRVNMTRLPQERALSPERVAALSTAVTFY